MEEYIRLAFYILLFLAGVYGVWGLARERRFRRSYNSREPLDDAAFYSAYYASSHIAEDIPRRLRPMYAEFFGLDPQKLHPLDWPPELEDVDTVDLVCDIEREFGVSLSDKVLEGINGSFDSIVQYLASCSTIESA